jgi:hypothetical protein
MTHSGADPSGASSEEPREVEVRWPDDVGADAEAINQVLFAWDQNIQDALYIYLGHIAPPPWMSPDIAQESLDTTGNRIQIKAKGSFIISRTRAEELWVALGRHLGKLPQ